MNPFNPVTQQQFQGWASFYGGNVQAPSNPPPSAFGSAQLGAPPSNGQYTGGWAYPDAWGNFYAGKYGFAAPQNQNTPAGALAATEYAQNINNPNDPRLLGWEQTFGNPSSILAKDQNWANSLGKAPLEGPVTGGWVNPSAWAAYYGGTHGFTAPENAGSPASALEAASQIAKTSNPQNNPALLGWVVDYGQPGSVLANTPNWAASLGAAPVNANDQAQNPQGGWLSPLAWSAYYGGFQGFNNGVPRDNTLQAAKNFAGVADQNDPSLLGWELDYGTPQTVVSQIQSSPQYKDYIKAQDDYKTRLTTYNTNEKAAEGVASHFQDLAYGESIVVQNLQNTLSRLNVYLGGLKSGTDDNQISLTRNQITSTTRDLQNAHNLQQSYVDTANNALKPYGEGNLGNANTIIYPKPQEPTVAAPVVAPHGASGQFSSGAYGAAFTGANAGSPATILNLVYGPSAAQFFTSTPTQISGSGSAKTSGGFQVTATTPPQVLAAGVPRTEPAFYQGQLNNQALALAAQQAASRNPRPGGGAAGLNNSPGYGSGFGGTAIGNSYVPFPSFESTIPFGVMPGPPAVPYGAGGAGSGYSQLGKISYGGAAYGGSYNLLTGQEGNSLGGGLAVDVAGTPLPDVYTSFPDYGGLPGGDYSYPDYGGLPDYTRSDLGGQANQSENPWGTSSLGDIITQAYQSWLSGNSIDQTFANWLPPPSPMPEFPIPSFDQKIADWIGGTNPNVTVDQGHGVQLPSDVPFATDYLAAPKADIGTEIRVTPYAPPVSVGNIPTAFDEGFGVPAPAAVPSDVVGFGADTLYQGGYGQPTLGVDTSYKPPAGEPPTKAEQFITSHGGRATLYELAQSQGGDAAQQMLDNKDMLGEGAFKTPLDLSKPLAPQISAVIGGTGFVAGKVNAAMAAHPVGAELQQHLMEMAEDAQEDRGGGGYGPAMGYNTTPVMGGAAMAPFMLPGPQPTQPGIGTDIPPRPPADVGPQGMQAGYNYPSGTFSGPQPIQAGYNYPAGSFGEVPYPDLLPPVEYPLQAGYRYIPGMFGEIDPYNFSSAPYPAGGYGGGFTGAPVEVGQGYGGGSPTEQATNFVGMANMPYGPFATPGDPLNPMGEALGISSISSVQPSAMQNPSPRDLDTESLMEELLFPNTDWSRFRARPSENVEYAYPQGGYGGGGFPDQETLGTSGEGPTFAQFQYGALQGLPVPEAQVLSPNAISTAPGVADVPTLGDQGVAAPPPNMFAQGSPFAGAPGEDLSYTPGTLGFLHGMQSRYEKYGGSVAQTEEDARAIADQLGLNFKVIGGSGDDVNAQIAAGKQYMDNNYDISKLLGFSAGGTSADALAKMYGLPDITVATGAGGQGGFYASGVGHMNQLAMYADMLSDQSGQGFGASQLGQTPTPNTDFSYLEAHGGHATNLIGEETNIGSEVDRGFSQDFANRLEAAGRAYKAATGNDPVYGEADRGPDIQDIYYQAYRLKQAGQPIPEEWQALGASGVIAAPPGSSRHQGGEAMDLPSSGFRDWLKAGNGARFGINFPVPGDAPHSQPIPNWQGSLPVQPLQAEGPGFLPSSPGEINYNAGPYMGMGSAGPMANALGAGDIGSFNESTFPTYTDIPAGSEPASIQESIARQSAEMFPNANFNLGPPSPNVEDVRYPYAGGYGGGGMIGPVVPQLLQAALDAFNTFTEPAPTFDSVANTEPTFASLTPQPLEPTSFPDYGGLPAQPFSVPDYGTINIPPPDIFGFGGGVTTPFQSDITTLPDEYAYRAIQRSPVSWLTNPQSEAERIGAERLQQVMNIEVPNANPSYDSRTGQAFIEQLLNRYFASGGNGNPDQFFTFLTNLYQYPGGAFPQGYYPRQATTSNPSVGEMNPATEMGSAYDRSVSPIDMAAYNAEMNAVINQGLNTTNWATGHGVGSGAPPINPVHIGTEIFGGEAVPYLQNWVNAQRAGALGFHPTGAAPPSLPMLGF